MQSIKVNLDTTDVKKLISCVLNNNKVLGLLGADLLVCTVGGRKVGGGNKQVVWIQASGIRSAIGCGDKPKCWIKSSCKGVGRDGSFLKDGDSFIHLSTLSGRLVVAEYTKAEVEPML